MKIVKEFMFARLMPSWVRTFCLNTVLMVEGDRNEN